MDIFTHAVAILVNLYATANAVFIPFGVLGAVIIDMLLLYRQKNTIPLSPTSRRIFSHLLRGDGSFGT
jgi:hypothetical protein